MISKRTQNLLAKYLVRQASFSELDELDMWIKDSSNKKEFINYIKTNYAIEYNLKNFNQNKVKNKIAGLIKNEKRIIRINRIQKISKYAAVFIGVIILVLALNVILLNNPKTRNNNSLVNSKINVIEPGTEKATLTLEDGRVLTLEKGETYHTQNAKSNGQKIIYKPDGISKSEIAYNYLTVPRGGQFFVELSDGTKVWLNSESKLKYPVNFIEGKMRVVELVYGEAFFDVSHSTEHKGAKFKVLNKSQEIEVLGTKFNIKAYKDERNIYTTLVKGKVAISQGNQRQELLPGEQSDLNLENKNIKITKVNVNDEISWINGVFSFSGKPLKDIMKTISRWYDSEVIFENKEIEDITFTGVLGKNQDIEKIMSTIKALGIVKDYQIKGKTIILK